jgi:hypothetical protein
MRLSLAISLVMLLGALAACGGERHARAVAVATSPVSRAPVATSTSLAVPLQSRGPKAVWGSPTTGVVPRLGLRGSPISYITIYVYLLDGGRRQAALSLWIDGATVPAPGTRITFTQTGRAHRASRDGMGMGTANWRDIVAVPGRYRETGRDGAASTFRSVDFLLVRSSRHEPWRILGVNFPT